jgi:hypothetical protein
MGHIPLAVRGHLDQCQMSDLGAAVICPPGSDCCDGSAHPGLSHDQAANSCTADHSEHTCPKPETCPVDGVGRGTDTGAECAGSHCGLGVEDCTVCRPVTIEVMPGGNVLQTVGA